MDQQQYLTPGYFGSVPRYTPQKLRKVRHKHETTSWLTVLFVLVLAGGAVYGFVYHIYPRYILNKDDDEEAKDKGGGKASENGDKDTWYSSTGFDVAILGVLVVAVLQQHIVGRRNNIQYTIEVLVVFLTIVIASYAIANRDDAAAAPKIALAIACIQVTLYIAGYVAGLLLVKKIRDQMGEPGADEEKFTVDNGDNLKLVTYRMAPGIYHSGLQFGGKEYAFDAPGIFQYDENGWGVGEPKITDLGAMTKDKFETALTKMRKKGYISNTYSMLTKNCNHFTEDMMRELRVGRQPRHINFLGKLGAAYDIKR